MKKNRLAQMACAVSFFLSTGCGPGMIGDTPPEGSEVRVESYMDSSSSPDHLRIDFPDPSVDHFVSPEAGERWEANLITSLGSEYGLETDRRHVRGSSTSVNSGYLTQRAKCVGWNRSRTYRAALTLTNDRGLALGSRMLDPGDVGTIEHESRYPEEDQSRLTCRLRVSLPSWMPVDLNDASLNVYLGYAPRTTPATAEEWLEYSDYFLPEADYDDVQDAHARMQVNLATPQLREDPVVDVTAFNRSPTDDAVFTLYEGDGVIDFWEMYHNGGRDAVTQVFRATLAPRELRTLHFGRLIRARHAYYARLMVAVPVDRDTNIMSLALGYRSEAGSGGGGSPGGTADEPVFLFRRIVAPGHFIPYTTRFPAIGTIDGTLNAITLPDDLYVRNGVAQVTFPKLGHSTDDCDDAGDVVALLPGESTSEADLEAIFGTRHPAFPIDLVACIAADRLVDLFPVRLEYSYR